MNQSDKGKAGKTILSLWTIILILIGAGLTGIGILLASKLPNLSNFIITLGAGILVGCIFSLILQQKELKVHIGEEISAAYQNEEFLKTLSSERLANLRTRIDQIRIGAVHLGERESLYKFIYDKLQDPFVDKPHRVNVIQSVLIEERQNEKEYLNVTTNNSYRVHHIAFQRTNLPTTYPLKCSSTIKVKYEDLKDIRHYLSIKVDGDEMVPESPEKIEYEKLKSQMNEVEGFFSSKIDDNYSHLFFRKEIQLKKESTQIVVHEKTKMKKNERSYYYQSYMPSYHFTLNLVLPEGYKINEPALGNVCYIPEEKISETNSIQGVGTNSVCVRMDSWILPGLIVFVDWEPPCG